jgi:hypothetical protein
MSSVPPPPPPPPPPSPSLFGTPGTTCNKCGCNCSASCVPHLAWNASAMEGEDMILTFCSSTCYKAYATYWQNILFSNHASFRVDGEMYRVKWVIPTIYNGILGVVATSQSSDKEIFISVDGKTHHLLLPTPRLS